MKNISKLSILLLFVLLLQIGLTACGNKSDNPDLLKTVLKRGKIIAGVKYDAKPFGFIDKDQALKGFDIDLTREISKRILGSENAVEFQQVTSSSRIISLNSGNVDLVAATMTINPKRALVIDFSSPYYIAGQALMVPVNSNIKSVKDLNNKRVIVILGSTAEDSIRQLAPNANILGFRTYTDGFSALKAGRADAMTTDNTILEGLVAEDHSFKMLKERYTKEPYGIGFRKSPETKSFQYAVNTSLENIAHDGTLSKIRKKWMPE